MPLSLKETLANEDFKGLPDVEKRKVLTTRFPDFALLPPLEQNKVLGFKEESFGKRAIGTAIGMGRGLATTVEGLGEFATAGGLRFLPEEQKKFLQDVETPRTPSEKVGKFAEQALEFAVPEALGARLAKGAPLLARMGLEGLKAAGVTGAQTHFDPKEMGKSAAAGAAFPVLGATTRLVGKYATDLLGLSTGVGGEVIRTVLNNSTQKLKSAMRGGKDEIEIAGDVRDAVQRVADARGASYRAQLAALPQKTLNVVNPVKTDLLKSLRSEYNIPARRKMVKTATGWVPGELELDFSHSTISNAADQNRILSLVTDLDHWKQNSTSGIDILKQRVDNLYREAGSDRAIIQNTKDQIRSSLNKEVPGYQKMTKEYAQASKFLDEIKKEFSTGGGTGTVIRKLANSLNQNNEYRKVMIEALGHASGIDLKSEIAGAALRPLMPRGLVARGFLGGAAVAAEHFLSGKPEAAMLLADLVASSPRAAGEILSLISTIKRNPAIRAGAAGAGQAARGAGLETLQQGGLPTQ